MFSPKPFELANNWDYSPFRQITFNLAMNDSASFLLLTSGSATDLALRSKNKISREAIEYRAKGMTIVNRRMMIPEQSVNDGTITACVILSGLEVTTPLVGDRLLTCYFIVVMGKPRNI